MYRQYHQSKIGLLQIEADEDGLTSIAFIDEETGLETSNSITEQTISELDEYFEGTRTAFDVPLNPSGSEFQKKVWTELLKIPYGKTITYQSQALSLGDVKAIRAVARANGQNPIAIIIPCHRVIGSDGSLTGYAGGLSNKELLLQHEGAIAPQLRIF